MGIGCVIKKAWRPKPVHQVQLADFMTHASCAKACLLPSQSSHRAMATKGQRQLSIGSAYLSATAARRGQTVCCRSEGSTVSPHISPWPPRIILQRLSALSTRRSRQSSLHSRKASTLHTIVMQPGDVCSHATARLVHVDLRDRKTRDPS
jgi:hypothetical protein